MKIRFLAGLFGALILATGCISTVTGEKTAGTRLRDDRIESRYNRSVPQVFDAAKIVLSKMGTVERDGTLFGETNTVRTLQGMVNNRKVWVRVEEITTTPLVTSITTQVRTKAGWADLDQAFEIDKAVLLQLTTGK